VYEDLNPKIGKIWIFWNFSDFFKICEFFGLYFNFFVKNFGFFPFFRGFWTFFRLNFLDFLDYFGIFLDFWHRFFGVYENFFEWTTPRYFNNLTTLRKQRKKNRIF